MIVEVASLETIPLREVWPDEARHFTPWLAANPNLLAEAIGLELELEGKEVGVGPFSADVVLREVSSGHRVVVENLLEATDHSHVGQLITYAAGLDAAYAVLVAKHFRPEHKTALAWLNNLSEEGTGFFGIEVGAVKIGNSDPAVRLDVVVEPDDWSRQVRSVVKRQSSDTNTRYAEWWSEFLPALREAYPGWTNATAAQAQNWMNFPAGRSDVRYGLSFAYPTSATNYSLRAEVYLGTGESSFPVLLERKEELEAECDYPLVWEELENARSSRIAIYLDPADPAVREEWPNYRAWGIAALGELRRVFAEAIGELPYAP